MDSVLDRAVLSDTSVNDTRNICIDTYVST